jgi:biotin carboxylase
VVVARVLLILPTETYRAPDFVDAADALGVELAVASEGSIPLLPADRAVRIDCSRLDWSAERVADLAATTPVDAIVAADDQGVVLAAMASERLGLPHNPPEAAAATRDKLAMRRTLATSEVPQPAFASLTPSEDPGTVGAAVGYPVVVKPRSLSGSRGVIRADGATEMNAATARIRRILEETGLDRDEPLIVERYMPGPEVSVEGILWDGDLEVLATFDKPETPDGPFFEETMFLTPTELDPATRREVHRVTAAAASAIGLTQGPVHAELRITDGAPRIVEIAARTIGGLCGRSLRFGLLGTPLEVLVLRHALGMRKESLRREPSPSGVVMLPVPGTGTLQSLEGVDEAQAIAGVTAVEMAIPVGSEVRALPEGDRYLGFVFARASEREEVVRALRHARSHIRATIV